MEFLWIESKAIAWAILWALIFKHVKLRYVKSLEFGYDFSALTIEWIYCLVRTK